MEEFEIPARKRQGVNVDIAPLMDMVFILLIFFIFFFYFNDNFSYLWSKNIKIL